MRGNMGPLLTCLVDWSLNTLSDDHGPVIAFNRVHVREFTHVGLVLLCPVGKNKPTTSVRRTSPREYISCPTNEDDLYG